MSPFVKLKRSGKKKEGLHHRKGSFLLFTTHCSLAWYCYTGLPTNTQPQAACHFLNQNESRKHLYKSLGHSKVSVQASSPLLLGLN